MAATKGNPSPSSFAETEALNSYSSIFISLSQQFIQQKRTAAASKALWKLGKKKRTKKKKEASIELRIEGPLWRCALHIRVSSRFNFEPFCAASFFWSAAATPICHSGTNASNMRHSRFCRNRKGRKTEISISTVLFSIILDKRYPNM